MRLGHALAARRQLRDPAAVTYARAALPASGTPWRQARWCALDFELTGLDRRHDEIISFGADPDRRRADPPAWCCIRAGATNA